MNIFTTNIYKILKPTTLLLLIWASTILSGFGQNEEIIEFEMKYITENFNNPMTPWLTTNDGGYFVEIKEGNYQIERKSTDNSKCIVFPDMVSYPVYQIRCTFKLIDNMNQKNKAGFFFNAKEGSNEMIMAELDYSNAFRLLKQGKKETQILTESIQMDGWIHPKAVKEVGAYNEFKVNVYFGKYYVYINEILVLTANTVDYKVGYFGILIGPYSRASFTKLEISIPTGSVVMDYPPTKPSSKITTIPSPTDQSENKTSTAFSSQNSSNQVNYRDLYVNEKKKVDKLALENENLLAEMEGVQMKDSATYANDPLKKILELGSKIFVLQTSINRSILMIDSLKRENYRLSKQLTFPKDSTGLAERYNVEKEKMNALEEQLFLATEMVKQLLSQGQEKIY